MAQLIEVGDATDARLADYRDLRDVQLRLSLEADHGLFLAEGEKVVRRALAAGFRARSLLLAPKWLDRLDLQDVGAPCYVMPERAIEEVTGYHVHRGALASFERLPHVPVDELLVGARRVAVLEGLVDHANVGAAFRNAAALGIEAVIVTAECADPLYRRAIKTSMGNVFNVPWTRTRGMEDTLAALRRHDIVPVAFTLSDDAITLDDLVALELPRTALIFGTEGAGVHPKTARAVDHRVRIPMSPGVDSLNVAASTAVAFYAMRSAPAGHSGG